MVFQPQEQIHLGAEAEVWSGSWMGKPAVKKIRKQDRDEQTRWGNKNPFQVKLDILSFVNHTISNFR